MYWSLVPCPQHGRLSTWDHYPKCCLQLIFLGSVWSPKVYRAGFQPDNDTEGHCAGGRERSTNSPFVCYAYQERGTGKDCLVSTDVLGFQTGKRKKQKPSRLSIKNECVSFQCICTGGKREEKKKKKVKHSRCLPAVKHFWLLVLVGHYCINLVFN